MSERDLIASQKSNTEPSQISGISRIKYLRRIISSSPPQYRAILEAYAQAPQMLGEGIINASNYIGDKGETVEVNIPLPAGLDSSREPIERDNELLLLRPELEEAIYVGLESNSSPSIIWERFSKPQITTINPPFKQDWQVIEGSVEAQPVKVSQHDADLVTNPYLKKAA